MKLNDFFMTNGFDISYASADLVRVSECCDWYNGIFPDFHRYYVYNGNKKIYKNRYSLNMPKKICENFADLILNEKTQITLSDSQGSKILNDILNKNNFNFKANQAVEKSFALGIGAFLVSLSEDIGIKIQFVSANNIIPLTYDSNDIFECAFMADRKARDGKIIRDIQIHSLDENKEYVIKNFCFELGNNGELEPCRLADIPSTIETHSNLPWFAIVKPNIVNNVCFNSPFGIPIFWNSLDVIKSIDIVYDSLVNEVQNGKKRLFVTSEALKVNGRGQLRDAFDPNDVLFYLLDSNLAGGNSQKYVQEVNGQLRINELRMALQTNLEILSLKLGLGRNYYRVGDDGSITRTATEVIASNSDLYRTINKHEILIEHCLYKLVNIIKYISKYSLGVEMNGEISVLFDDSVIESNASKRRQDIEDVSIGAMSLAEYRSKWYGEPIELAEERINKIKTIKFKGDEKDE